MKQLLVVAIALIASTSIFSQKTMTAEQMNTFTKGAFEAADFDQYIGSDGHTYKVGDTLKIGRPSNNKTFSFIQDYTGVAGALAGTPMTYTAAGSSGSNTIIKRIYAQGTKRAGFQIYIIGKGLCGLCPNYLINFEEAIAVNELKSLGMNKENAIAKLKEQKELLDMGMITQEQFEKIKSELAPLIMKN